MSLILKIDPKKETKKITDFIAKTLKEQGFDKVVVGASGGIDSAVVLYLLRKVLPSENIIVAHLPYFNNTSVINKIKTTLQIPKNNYFLISVKKPVEAIKRLEKINNNDKVRLGNVMARTRMIVLFDLTKKYNALVAGTENKSERLLGYFTRFGDAASDFEPISHLYKTQVYQLAEYLNVPKEFIDQAPTAGLWNGQTDEGQFGFTYEEADRVLYLYYDKKVALKQIEKMDFPNAKKIVDWSLRNEFKHKTPYHI